MHNQGEKGLHDLTENPEGYPDDDIIFGEEYESLPSDEERREALESLFKDVNLRNHKILLSFIKMKLSLHLMMRPKRLGSPILMLFYKRQKHYSMIKT